MPDAFKSVLEAFFEFTATMELFVLSIVPAEMVRKVLCVRMNNYIDDIGNYDGADNDSCDQANHGISPVDSMIWLSSL